MIPEIASQECDSPATYPYRFPKSGRRLGGKLSVDECVQQLVMAYHFHHQLMRVIAGWLIRIPEFEIKLESAHHLYQHAQAALLLRTRLEELRFSIKKLDSEPLESVVLLCREAEHAQNSAELMTAIHLVLGEHLRAMETKYVEDTDALLDQPSIRVLRQVLPDMNAMIGWASDVHTAFNKGGYPEAGLIAWQKHMSTLLSSTLDRKKVTTPTLRQNTQPYRRSNDCARDDRFTTFRHTRRYGKEEMPDVTKDSEDNNPYHQECLALMRVQRDELDAVETFANVLYDLPSPPFELELTLARFIWDEARHAEIGHQSLERLGYEPFSIPCGIIGIVVRASLPPLIAFAQISLFGELGQVQKLLRLSRRGYERGDHNSGMSFDFIHADEVLHLRAGRTWLRSLAKDGDLRALQEEAYHAAIKRLHEEGIVDEDFEFEPSTRELAEMIGE